MWGTQIIVFDVLSVKVICLIASGNMWTWISLLANKPSPAPGISLSPTLARYLFYFQDFLVLTEKSLLINVHIKMMVTSTNIDSYGSSRSGEEEKWVGVARSRDILQSKDELWDKVKIKIKRHTAITSQSQDKEQNLTAITTSRRTQGQIQKVSRDFCGQYFGLETIVAIMTLVLSGVRAQVPSLCRSKSSSWLLPPPEQIQLD